MVVLSARNFPNGLLVSECCRCFTGAIPFCFIPITLVVRVEYSVRCVYVCVSICLSVRAITSDANYFWPKYLASWFNSTLSGSNLNVNVIGQSSRSHDEKRVLFLATDARYNLTYFMNVKFFVLKWRSSRPQVKDFWFNTCICDYYLVALPSTEVDSLSCTRIFLPLRLRPESTSLR